MANCKCGKQICSFDHYCPECKEELSVCYECGDYLNEDEVYIHCDECYCHYCYDRIDCDE